MKTNLNNILFTVHRHESDAEQYSFKFFDSVLEFTHCCHLISALQGEEGFLLACYKERLMMQSEVAK